MEVLNHPVTYKCGTRVLRLLSRNKDTGENKKPLFRISHDWEKFDENLAELSELASPGQRIYGSLNPCDLVKAAYTFEEKLLNARKHDAWPLPFYDKLQANWVSCLEQPENAVESGRVWLVDIDGFGYKEFSRKDIVQELGLKTTILHRYVTKNGEHLIVEPFNSGHCEFLPLINKSSPILWRF